VKDILQCSGCGVEITPEARVEANWYSLSKKSEDRCPACVQEDLLRVLLAKGDAALHEAVQLAWPLDAEATFGVLPTRLRLHADPRFSGKGVTIAVVDSGFYPHPDLIAPQNRIRAWVDATHEEMAAIRFGKKDRPQWPDWDGARDWEWHGTMTSVVACGNGFLSRGLYSSLAPDAEIVLVQVRDTSGGISSDSIARALGWVRRNAQEFAIRVVSLSVSGDSVWPLSGNAVDEAVASLVEDGINVIAAAGNDGERKLLPPATAPFACTVGGIDDKNTFCDEDVMLWHSNYGSASNGVAKPEFVAPSIWVAAPVLPQTKTAEEARLLFEQRGQGNSSVEDRLAELKLITPHYQHVDGTSFAAPLVASAIACILEANGNLSPLLVRSILIETAHVVRGADRARQGAGAVAPGQAVARALAERHEKNIGGAGPQVSPVGVVFSLHDHDASRVQVLGSWNDWNLPCVEAACVERGYWQTHPAKLPKGRHTYKFLLDGDEWLDDPANPKKAPDGLGGLNSVVDVP
jgi:serine protease AprX